MQSLKLKTIMIDWLIQSSVAHPDLRRGVAPAGLLNPNEQHRLAAMPIAKRRNDWLLGRWTAKRLVQSYIAQHGGARVPLERIVVTNGPDGAPQVQADETHQLLALYNLQLLSLSISHCDGHAFCALTDGSVRIGADIERITPRAPVFAEDYFTAHELAQLRAAPPASRDMLVTLIWSAKEAVLKALHLGLTVDTRSVSIMPGPAPSGRMAWAPLTVLAAPAAIRLEGWWQVVGEYVLTLAQTRAP